MSISSFPGFDNLFFLKWPKGASDFNGRLTDKGGLQDFEITRGESTPSGISVKWVRGNAIPGPFVHLLSVSTVLFSSQVLDALQMSGVTGWEARPIRLIGKGGGEICSYFLLVVHGRCGVVQYERSERTVKSYPAREVPTIRGMYFDESSWDGSDVFMCQSGHESVMVTKKARDAILSVTRKVKFPALTSWEMAEYALEGVPGFTPRTEA